MKSLILSIAIFALGSFTFANPPAGVSSDITARTAPAASATSSSTQISGMNSPSQNQAARDGQSSNAMSSIISALTGSGLIAKGSSMISSCSGKGCPCCPAALMLIGMGMQALQQSGANSSTAGDHGYNASTNVDSMDKNATLDTRSALSQAGFKAGDLDPKKVADDLKKYGITQKNGQFVLPNGSTVSSDYMNKESMSKSGVSGSDYDKAMALVKSLEKQATEKIGAMTPTNGFDSGGSGSSATSNSNSDALEHTLTQASKKPDLPTSVEGMTRNFNGEVIGVAGDDLFSMMARRYRKKSQEDGFLPPEDAPVSRSASSVGAPN